MGGLQNRDVAARLSDAPEELVRELRAAYRKAARRAAGRTRDRIRAADSRHPGGLRERIAATVAVSVTRRGDGVVAAIRSAGSRMPEGEENLPAYADGETRRWQRWRHPVYGHETVWVSQTWPSARGWFTGTLHGEKDRFAEAVRKSLDELAARLDRR